MKTKPLLLALALTSIATAHEGMWTPQQLPQIAGDLKATGLALDPAQLTDLTAFPMGAIISLGNCTASFVSPEGLVVTNHHCAYGSIQFNSTADKNLIEQGFLAKAQTDELRAAPGSRVYVTVDVRNVADRILDKRTKSLTGKALIDAMEANEKGIVAECEKDAGHRCNVYGFYGGLEFHLIKQLEIRDVRLAYAPAVGVGAFGGDTDNWMWPRHTGDFSFYRAYVGKDGKPADFSAENVPYRPKHFLHVAKKGVKEGDFVMVTGYPGRTSRHRLPSEVSFTFDWSYPKYIETARQQLDIIAAETKGRKDAEIAYASTVQGINNTYKNRQGMLEGYKSSGLLPQKQQELAELKAWVAADKSRTAQYGKSITAIEEVLSERNEIARREFLLGSATPRLIGVARTLNELAHEKAKAKDLARKPGFQERDWPRIRQGLEVLNKRYDNQVDEALVLHFLEQYLALPVAEQNAAFTGALGVKSGMSTAELRARLDILYAGSKLADSAERLAWFDRDVAAFAKSEDAFIKAGVALYADDQKREARDKAIGGRVQRAYASYMQALLAWKSSKGEAVYPDANSTLRVSFGKVASRSVGQPDGTAWTAFTTLRGIAAKHTGEGEFDAPDAQLAAIKAKRYDEFYDSSLDSVPVNFLATLDITGGNSGSPVLNSRAELVGLAFDGTLDAVISDWTFDDAITRTICVDARYMLWQMKVVDKADRLLQEMGVGAQPSG